MQIANPIYDIVFKYLMEDNKIAILLISSIIGEEIESLDFRPKEGTVELELPTPSLELDRRSLTVYRLDFSAKIKTPTGFKTVLIEIQKAKLATDIIRFRRYISEQYGTLDNTYEEFHGDKKVIKAIPILSIYFLGEKLDHIIVPIIKVKRLYYDLTTGKEIVEREDFIESLTHDSFIIQISKLREKRRTELEVLLSVFDQRNIDSDHHILNIKEEDFPEKYHVIIRRLQRAIAEPKVRNIMNVEDEILGGLRDMERVIEKKDQVIEEKEQVIEEKEQVIEEKEQVIEEKEQVIEEKEQVIETTVKALETSEKANNAKDKLIEELKKKLKNKS